MAASGSGKPKRLDQKSLWAFAVVTNFQSTKCLAHLWRFSGELAGLQVCTVTYLSITLCYLLCLSLYLNLFLHLSLALYVSPFLFHPSLDFICLLPYSVSERGPPLLSLPTLNIPLILYYITQDGRKDGGWKRGGIGEEGEKDGKAKERRGGDETFQCKLKTLILERASSSLDDLSSLQEHGWKLALTHSHNI